MSQLRADTFLERLTGQATGAAVPVKIALTVRADALLAGCDDAPATLPGHGPLLAPLRWPGI